MVRRAAMMIVCAAFAGAAPASAQGRLDAAPLASAAENLPLGISRLDKASFVYRPAPTEGRKPGVVVLFHGAGGDARRFIELFRGEADRRGLILLSVQSIEDTWDIIGAGDSMNVGRVRSAAIGGRDARRVDAALAALFQRAAVDPDHVLAAGFSDGASYALSLALANGQLFRGVIALAPGFIRYSNPRRPLRIAISHGTQDRVLPFDNARRMADQLRDRSQQVSFLPFEGGHAIEDRSLAKALDFTLQAGGA